MRDPVGARPTRVVVEALEGDVDAVSARRIHELVGQTMDGGHQTLVIDLAGVTFMDSQGINALIWAEQRIKGAGGDLILRRPSAAVRRALEVTGLDALFVIDT